MLEYAKHVVCVFWAECDQRFDVPVSVLLEQVPFMQSIQSLLAVPIARMWEMKHSQTTPQGEARASFEQPISEL
jgi:hypothetical protein